MANMKRSATTESKEGISSITTGSGVLNDVRHSFGYRFKDNEPNNTTPEELIAAAHSDCFTGMLKTILEKAKIDVQYLRTQVVVTVDTLTHAVISSHIYVVGKKTPNITKERFIELATLAKNTCPISKLLKTNILLDCELE